MIEKVNIEGYLYNEKIYNLENKKRQNELLKLSIKSNFKIDIIMYEELSFKDKFKLLFISKLKLETDEVFGFKETIFIKYLNNKIILVKHRKGSTKELL